jgi:hypothetical protein
MKLMTGRVCVKGRNDRTSVRVHVCARFSLSFSLRSTGSGPPRHGSGLYYSTLNAEINMHLTPWNPLRRHGTRDDVRGPLEVF